MPKEYIERSYAEYLVDYFGSMLTWNKEDILSEIKRNLDRGKIADVVEVIRCGECIHSKERKIKDTVICSKYNAYKNINGFCEAGEKKV